MTSLARSESAAPGILRVLVTVYVALLPFQFQVERAINFAPSDCLMLLVLIFAIGQLKYRKPAWSAWHFGIILIFTAGSLVASLRFGTLDRYELLNKDAGLLLPFLSYVAITSAIADWEDIRHILRVFTLSVVIQNIGAVAAFLAAYFYGVANPFTRYEGLRLAGMLLDPNAYGGLLVMALVMIEAASWGPSPLFRESTLWISRLTLVVGILFTFSRSAWVALGISLLLLCIVKTRIAGRLVVAGLAGAPCIFLVMGQRFLPIFERMASRPKQVEGRFELIHDAFAAFLEHPLFGGGMGSFRLSEGYIAHNSAMWFLADFGVIGLTVFLGFLGWFFLKGWFAYRFAPSREQPVALALLVAHTSMTGLAMGIEAFYQRHWWLAFGLIASAYSLALRRTADVPAPCGGLCQ
jgi:putative inorganic carbon (hco3(-)) transporter